MSAFAEKTIKQDSCVDCKYIVVSKNQTKIGTRSRICALIFWKFKMNVSSLNEFSKCQRQNYISFFLVASLLKMMPLCARNFTSVD